MGFLLPVLAFAAVAPGPARRDWTVGGVRREALVAVPAGQSARPARLVFDFHGHGGTAANAARTHALHAVLPDAVVVYPQGLPTPGRLSDPDGKKSGWQHAAGDQADRDLKFFDAMLASLTADHGTDPKRVYATGHSNGGAFAYLLWAERADKLAAVAPVAAGGGPRVIGKLTPKPCLHVAGEADPLVRFAVQKRVMEAVRRANKCGPEGTPWEGKGKLYPAPGSAAFVAVVHPGGHEYPESTAGLIGKFFRQHPAD